TDAPDEIGDLARSFEKLFVAVGGYTDYLRTLASKLSHELNTPLAIVKSSLDNLEHALQERAALPDQAVPYLARARDGVARLGALVRAMSESSRMERSIEAAEPEDVDLRDVVRGCADGYRPLVGTRRLDCRLPDAPLPAAMQGRLFDSLVSLRDKAVPGEAPHLGLGLYVVRLVAERHGGSVS